MLSGEERKRETGDSEKQRGRETQRTRKSKPGTKRETERERD